MRLDKHKEYEVAKRQGFAKRTIIQTIWLLISGVISFFVLRWLFDTGYITYSFFYNTLGVPSSIPQELLFGASILVLVAIMQFFLILGFAFASPVGRQRPGTPSAYTRTVDPFADDYNH
jgi:ABC-type sugar transport system permease subunit